MARSLLALALTVSSVGCAGRGSRGASSDPEQRRMTDAGRALCEAASSAREGNVGEAERLFQDRVHAYLHDLADRLSTFDRQAVGDLLVAKQQVEAALGSSPDPGDVADLLEELGVALAAAGEEAGLTAPMCEAAA